jgi:hypothetical protein
MRLYAAVFLAGLAGRMGWVELPGSLDALEHPLVLTAAGFMLCVEFFADKIPALDSLWDGVHTFIRIPAGALLAAWALADQSTPVMLAGALLGGSLTAGTHLTKAGSRIAINTSPEPVSNLVASAARTARRQAASGWPSLIRWSFSDCWRFPAVHGVAAAARLAISERFAVLGGGQTGAGLTSISDPPRPGRQMMHNHGQPRGVS